MFLSIGYSPSEFWEYSIKELVDIINGYNEQKKRETAEKIAEYKMLATMNEVLAIQIAQHIAPLLVGTDAPKPNSLSDFFPSLFKSNSSDSNNDIEINKEQFKAYAARWNKKRKEVNDGRNGN